jgi:hypothetical protein
MKTNFIVVGLIGGSVSAFVAPRQVAAPCVSRTALFSAKARAKHQQKQQKEDSAKFIEQGINEFNATGEVELESFRTSSNLAPLFLKDEKTDEVSPSAISDASPAAESGQEETILKVIENQLIGMISCLIELMHECAIVSYTGVHVYEHSHSCAASFASSFS